MYDRAAVTPDPLLLAAIRVVARSGDPDATLDELLEIGLRATGADRAGAFLWDAGRGGLALAGSRGYSAHDVPALEKEYRATRLHSSGGFLKQSNATIVLGVEDDQVDDVMSIIAEHCTSRTQVVNPMPPIMEPGEFFMPYPLEVEVGGATVFVLPVDRFERL